MKRMMLAVIGVGALLVWMNRPRLAPISLDEIGAQAAPEQTIESQISLAPDRSAKLQTDRGEERTKPAAREGDQPERKVALGQSAGADVSLLLDQAIETLVSAQAGFELKQAAWQHLKATGKLDEAISELEQRKANDPGRAEYAAALGQAYLKKCALMEDVREQAMLAMKADQTLEAALSLDPSNWEARYAKAVGMSYWPAQLNKQQEVIEQFQTLIQQQEGQPQQPQFARSYAWLGDQYQKAGYADYAVQVWQRGATLFPNNEELKGKLASAH